MVVVRLPREACLALPHDAHQAETIPFAKSA
jgi:hypothetical protein